MTDRDAQKALRKIDSLVLSRLGDISLETKRRKFPRAGSWLVHLIGGNATGKSDLVGCIGERCGAQKGSYGNYTPSKELLLLGAYARRQTGGGSGWVGGMDGIHTGTVGRLAMVEKAWLSPYRVVMLEGHMTMYWSSYVETYLRLLKKRKRYLCFVLICSPSKELKRRLDMRSKGLRPWQEARAKNIAEKWRVAANFFRRLSVYQEQHPNIPMDLWMLVNAVPKDRKINIDLLMHRVGLQDVVESTS